LNLAFRKRLLCVLQGCQMVLFQTKNPNLGKFWRALEGNKLIYFRAIWNIYGYLGYFMTVW
jgi:hypothetical protein